MRHMNLDMENCISVSQSLLPLTRAQNKKGKGRGPVLLLGERSPFTYCPKEAFETVGASYP